MRSLKHWSVWTSIGMFIVVLMGAVVTKTGSGEGCGDDWPLCNGKFIPAYTIPSIIEYSHRLVSGIVGILVLITFILVWRKIKERKDLRMYAMAALILTIVQAILGMMAVKWSQSDLVMALHFGISLLAFASTFLLALGVVRIERPWHPSGWGEALTVSEPVTRSFQWLVWLSLIGTYVVVYLGAYVVHTESISGCTGWPTCNGAWIPDLSLNATLIAFIHRIGAVVLFLNMVWMVVYGLKRHGKQPEIRNSSWASLAAIVLQIVSGGFVAISLTQPTETMHLYTSLFHTVIICALFGILCYLALVVWQLRWDQKNASSSK